MTTDDGIKVRSAMASGRKSPAAAYCRITYGNASTSSIIRAELVQTLFGSKTGALGYYFRKVFYPCLFASCGTGVVFGARLTLRQPARIQLGSNVIIDDNVVLDAKGDSNSGIRIEDNVYIGRNTLIYCKNGNITIRKGTSISSNCTVFSANSLTIGEDVMIGGYTYLLSGGKYDFSEPFTKFTEQDGLKSSGPLTIGANSWLGARVTVLDGCSIGERCVIGACSLVTKPVSSHSLAFGNPARIQKQI
jgi:acetyltransferase-like isoleucine patch superfamily enzyme